MRGQVAAILLVAVLVFGVGIAYFVNTSMSNTTTLPPRESNVMRCILTHYAVFETAHIQSSTTNFGSTTDTADLQTYTTTASVSQTLGFATTSTSTYTGTITGALAEGNYTSCTYISG